MNTVTESFWIIGLAVTYATVDVPTIIQLGKGASGSEAAVADFKTRGYTVTWLPLPSPVKVAANTRIAARVAQYGGTGQAIDIAVAYLTGL